MAETTADEGLEKSVATTADDATMAETRAGEPAATAASTPG
jgi:hypothetical protein